MGQEIDTDHFTDSDFTQYRKILREETALLESYFKEGLFSRIHGVGGFELEGWLTDKNYMAAPINEQYLEALNDPMVGAELAMFNVELNTAPHPLEGGALALMEKELGERWKKCCDTAEELDAKLLMIGILPTVQSSELAPKNMSTMKRYRALNDRVVNLRCGDPVMIDIQGKDRLRFESNSVMLEAATTSFQAQFQVDAGRATRCYNGLIIASAPIIAVSANSPFMFGKDLWDETRIPVFEQSLSGCEDTLDNSIPPSRVTLGSSYAVDSLFEVFKENLDLYKILLPMVCDDKPEKFSHLRLHNGVVWRWNRPLIGVEDENSPPHIRIEHRVIPAGPSVTDVIANAALLYGLSEELSSCEEPPEQMLAFKDANDNFYKAAKHGMRAEIKWLDGKTHPVREVILNELLPMAKAGLTRLGIRDEDIDKYLGVIEKRAENSQNGAAWQRKFARKNNNDMRALCEAYYIRQQSGTPVHDWTI